MASVGGSCGWWGWLVVVKNFKIFWGPNELKSPKNNLSFYYFFSTKGGGLGRWEVG